MILFRRNHLRKTQISCLGLVTLLLALPVTLALINTHQDKRQYTTVPDATVSLGTVASGVPGSANMTASLTPNLGVALATVPGTLPAGTRAFELVTQWPGFQAYT